MFCGTISDDPAVRDDEHMKEANKVTVGVKYFASGMLKFCWDKTHTH